MWPFKYIAFTLFVLIVHDSEVEGGFMSRAMNLVARQRCKMEESKKFRFDYPCYDSEVDGWFKFHRIPAVWRDARLRCKMEGAVLASPNDSPLLGGLKQVILDNVGTTRGVYIGTNARFSKGDFFSIEGVPLTGMPVDWLPNEPDNLNNNEECLMMMSNGSIADVSCSRVLPYVCYKKRTPDVVINGCGTTDREYYLEPRTGSCYKFHSVRRTWSRAYMACAAEGGHLAIINSQQEALVLKEIFANKLPEQGGPQLIKETMHIGFHNWDEREDWTTINGVPISEPVYQVFFHGQPDTEKFCGGMMRDGEMDYTWCGVVAPFVCEMKPDSLQQELTLNNSTGVIDL